MIFLKACCTCPSDVFAPDLILACHSTHRPHQMCSLPISSLRVTLHIDHIRCVRSRSHPCVSLYTSTTSDVFAPDLILACHSTHRPHHSNFVPINPCFLLLRYSSRYFFIQHVSHDHCFVDFPIITETWFTANDAISSVIEIPSP